MRLRRIPFPTGIVPLMLQPSLRESSETKKRNDCDASVALRGKRKTGVRNP
jgi:hypothetical protein